MTKGTAADRGTQEVERCVIVVDGALPAGLAANAAAVLALTLGATAPELVGPGFRDADGRKHPGLVTRGLPVLRGTPEQLQAVHGKGHAMGAGVIGLPAFGQQTTDYDRFRQRVGETAAAELVYLGVLVHGPKRLIGKLTGHLPLLR